MVRVTGLEPVRLSTQEPKSCTSTNSAIPADNPPFNPSLSVPLQRRKGCVFLFLLIIKQNHSHTLVRIYRRCISAHRLHRLSFPHRWVLLSRHNPWFVKAAPEKKRKGVSRAPDSNRHEVVRSSLAVSIPMRLTIPPALQIAQQMFIHYRQPSRCTIMGTSGQ